MSDDENSNSPGEEESPEDSSEKKSEEDGKGEARKKGERKYVLIFFFQAEDGIRDYKVTGVQTCALPILVPIQENIGTTHF